MNEKNYHNILNKIKRKLRNNMLLLFLALLIALSCILYFIVTEKTTDYTNTLNTHIKDTVYALIFDLTHEYKTTLEKIVTNKNVGKYFYEKNKEKLLTSMLNEWNFTKARNPDVTDIRFHTADGKLFLSMKEPNNNSKDLTTRNIIKDMHKNNSLYMTYKGFETTAYDFDYKIIKPIYNEKNNYLGAIEISISLDYILSHIEEDMGVKGYLLIRNQDLKKYKYTYNYNLELSKYSIPFIINKKEIQILKNIPNDYDFQSSLLKFFNNEMIFYTTVNIFDYKLDSTSKLLFYKDISSLLEQEKKIVITSIFILLILLLFIILLTKYLFKYLVNTLEDFFSKIIDYERKEKEYINTIKDATPNFVITTTGNEILSMNKSSLEFVSFKSIEKFKEKYNCICEFFIKKDGYIQKKMEGTVWINYIIKNPNKIHKVLMKKDGKIHTFLVHAIKFTYSKNNIYIAIFSDITDIEKLTLDYKYIIKRNQFAEQGANLGLWDWDMMTDKVYYSKIWKKILGYEEDEISDSLEEWHKRIHPDDKRKVMEDLENNFNKKTSYFANNHRLKHKDGHYIYASFRGQAIYNQLDIPHRVVGIYVDDSEMQENREKIKEQEKLMLAQSKHAAMGEMISMIAHQWRQPIASIAMGVNNMLLDVEIDSINKNDLKLECNGILEQTAFLSNTIEDFRTFFKEDKEKSLVNIENVIDDAIKLMQGTLSNNNVVLSTMYFQTSQINTYPNEILQILLNLIKNAKEVLVEKKVKEKFIKIYTTEDDEYIYIDVEDNAGGIPSDILDRVFEAYFTTKDEHNGTGLGLYMSKKIANEHLHGNLTVKNSNEGAIFTVSILKN
ncbi:ATP-binding protein [Sulfurospirillum arcachonense]|uniref:ATP-binding protein n=1 Tax=Sulfurospirillum arcachonense TaxID=57666 RepID=UPI000468F249